MLDPLRAIASATERYPRTSSALTQLLLGLVSFACVLSIARYDHDPDGSAPVFVVPVGVNVTHERVCGVSAREADVPVGALRYAIPYFMLCPSTVTIVGVCSVYVACLVQWSSFYSDSPAQILPFLPLTVVLLCRNINWERILESVQMLLPMYIWNSYFTRALFDALFRCAMPGTYANLVEKKNENRRLAEEKRNKSRIGDIEGTLFDEETPLAGRGFTRDGNEAYV